MTTPENAPEPTTAAPPAVIKVASALLVLTAVAWLGMGIWETVNIRLSRPEVGVGAALLMVLYAVALGLIARGLMRLRPWSRGPAVATQLCQLPVAYSFLGGPTMAVGVVMGVVSLAVIGCLLSPSATRALVRD
ncbi:hypothetical protein [Mariniluteicoccus endophyticus]